MLSKGMFSTKIFTRMLSVASNWITLLPSMYTYLHSHRSSLAWEETINRDAKRSMKNPNLTTGFVQRCMLCQRKAPAQCRGRCCRQHLLGGLPISATIQPFNVCKDLAQERVPFSFPCCYSTHSSTLQSSFLQSCYWASLFPWLQTLSVFSHTVT